MTSLQRLGTQIHLIRGAKGISTAMPEPRATPQSPDDQHQSSASLETRHV